MGQHWDPGKVDASHFELLNDNKQAHCISSTTGQSAIGEKATFRAVYWEIEILSFNSYQCIGLCTPDHTSTDRTGFNGYSWGWMENQRLYHGGSHSGTDTAFGAGDVLMVAVDPSANKVWFGRNGVWNDSGDPANGMAPSFNDAGITGDLFPCFSLRSNGGKIQLRVFSFELSYSPPSGFIPLGVSSAISGTVQEEGVNVQRVVRAYKRSDGSFSGGTISASDGTFSITVPNEEHYLIFLDDETDGTDYNAIIFDRITPINN